MRREEGEGEEEKKGQLSELSPQSSFQLMLKGTENVKQLQKSQRAS